MKLVLNVLCFGKDFMEILLNYCYLNYLNIWFLVNDSVVGVDVIDRYICGCYLVIIGFNFVLFSLWFVYLMRWVDILMSFFI